MNLLTRTPCTGHCCRAFIIKSHSPGEIKFLISDLESCDSLTKVQQSNLDICKMLIPLGADPYKLPLEAQKIIPLDNFDRDDHNYYTCKHHNVITGECMDYENRPSMCSGFPENASEHTNWNGSCINRGCTRRYSLLEIVINYIKSKKSKLHTKWCIWKWRIKNYFFPKDLKDILKDLPNTNPLENGYEVKYKHDED